MRFSFNVVVRQFLAFPAAFFGAALAVLNLVASEGHAQEHHFWLGLDLDLDSATGCDITGGDVGGEQTITGLEWSLAVDVNPTVDPPSVQALSFSECDAGDTVAAPTWTRPSADTTTPWNVGVDVGEAGGDVIELRIVTDNLELGEVVRLVALSESAGGHRDLLVTEDGTSSGGSILFPSATAVPAQSMLGWVLLVCTLMGAGHLVLRWSATNRSLLWGVIPAIVMARVAWALTLSLNGDVSEWSVTDEVAADPSGDSETGSAATGDPASDLLALFAAWDGTDIAIRVDFADLEAELCDGAHAGTPCYYVSSTASSSGTGSAAAPWQTLSEAATHLNANAIDGARIQVEAGTYTEAEQIQIFNPGTEILGLGVVTISNTISDFTSAGGWVSHDPTLSIYRSDFTYLDAGTDVSRAWGHFSLGGEEKMLVSYTCYDALAASHSLHPGTGAACADKPYIGPGVYWDKDGTQGDMGRIYVRMVGGPTQFDAVLADNGWTLPTDPNSTSMKITINGPWLQLNADDILVRNLALELGSVRIGGGTTGGTLEQVTLDGPAFEGPIEIYSGASSSTFDELLIDQKLPAWITWQDTKRIFSESLQHSAITMNGIGTASDSIHHVTLTNSTIQNAYDGLELNNDEYRHLWISGNVFHNIQDDAIQLGSSTYEIEIDHNTFTEVGTGVSRHGTGANAFPGRKYIHHNFIDTSTAKYFCREPGDDGLGCTGDGSQTLKGFNNHEGIGWGIDGDPRYIYNNTVVVNDQNLGVGFLGQDRDTQLPYENPSLVFNNVFVQLSASGELIRQSPKWISLAPVVLLMDGNLYYRPADASVTNGAFVMSNNDCDFDLFRTQQCIYGTDPEEISGVWTETLEAQFNWEFEPQGLFDDANLDLASYVPDCTWLTSQVDATSGDVIEAVDLTAIEGAYTVSTTDGTPVWTLELAAPLPGVDGAYRGYTDCPVP